MIRAFIHEQESILHGAVDDPIGLICHAFDIHSVGQERGMRGIDLTSYVALLIIIFVVVLVYHFLTFTGTAMSSFCSC